MNSALCVNRLLCALLTIVCIASTGCVSCTQPSDFYDGCASCAAPGGRVRQRAGRLRSGTRNLVSALRRGDRDADVQVYDGMEYGGMEYVGGGCAGGGCAGGGCASGACGLPHATCDGGFCNRPYPPGMTPGGMPNAMAQYPYYTIRGPRDFLMKNPPSIGP